MSYSKTILFLMCGVCALALDASEARTVALSSLLAPVSDLGSDKTVKKEVVDPEPKESRPTFRMLGISDVLLRMERDLSDEMDPSDRLSLTSQFNWSGVKVREDLDWDVRLQTPFNPRSNGRWYPLFDLLVDGRVISEYRIPIQVSLVKEVWVVEQNASRGAQVDSSIVKPEARDIYAERGSPIDAKESLANYETARSLSRGQLLTWDDLDERPHVRKNAIVHVEYNKGALQIHMRGRAMEDGMHGDLITIRNMDTSREFVAQVHGENHVKFQN